MDEVLHKRGLSQPYLRCLTPDESTLVHKTVRVGYYWLSMQINTKSYDRACDKCQYLSNVPRQPLKYLTPMVALWPFAWWGLDILGPFHMGTRQMKFLVVRINYFTKWVEAEPLAKTTEQNVRNFV